MTKLTKTLLTIPWVGLLPALTAAAYYSGQLNALITFIVVIGQIPILIGLAYTWR